MREYGEIGKHAGFKILCRKASRFKSEYSHHLFLTSCQLQKSLANSLTQNKLVLNLKITAEIIVHILIDDVIQDHLDLIGAIGIYDLHIAVIVLQEPDPAYSGTFCFFIGPADVSTRTLSQFELSKSVTVVVPEPQIPDQNHKPRGQA